MPHRFIIGDIVKCTEDGASQEVYGYNRGELKVIELCPDPYLGMSVIRVRPVDQESAYGGRWREMWYELVDPEGPW